MSTYRLASLFLLAGLGCEPVSLTPPDEDASAPPSTEVPPDAMADAAAVLDAAPPPALRQIVVAVDEGAGGGKVTANGGGIDCGQACIAEVLDGTPLTFTAQPDVGSMIVGWRGDAVGCGREPTCHIVVSGAPLELGARFAATGTAAWTAQIGGFGDDGWGTQVTADRDGNVLFGAGFYQQITFDGVVYPTHGSLDALLVNVSPAGDVRWVRPFQAAGEEQLMDIATDPRNGDVVVLGTYGGDLDTGGPSLLPLAPGDNKDFFVAKYAADGQWLWHKAIRAGDGNDYGLAGIRVNTSGDIVLGGVFSFSIDLGDGPLTTVEDEMFLAKLAGADGHVLWKKKLGGASSYGMAADLTLDAFGNVLLAGSFVLTINLGGASMTAQSGDGFVAKFAGSNGAFLWQRQIGGTGEESVNAIATDSSGSVYVAIGYQVVSGQPVTFAGVSLPGTSTGYDIVIGALRSDNDYLWGRRFGTTNIDTPLAIAVLADGSVAFAGTSRANIVFGGTTLMNAGGDDGFLVRLAVANGNPLWAVRLAGGGHDRPENLAAAGSVVVVTGSFAAQLDAAGKPLVAVGLTDAFAAAVVPGP